MRELCLAASHEGKTFVNEVLALDTRVSTSAMRSASVEKQHHASVVVQGEWRVEDVGRERKTEDFWGLSANFCGGTSTPGQATAGEARPVRLVL